MKKEKEAFDLEVKLTEISAKLNLHEEAAKRAEQERMRRGSVNGGTCIA